MVESRSSAHQTTSATTPAVTATPTVARAPADAPTERNASGWVPMPPSNRMTTSATTAMSCTSGASSKRTIASPSSATSIPRPRNSRRLGMRQRDVRPLAITPTSSRTPPSRTPASTEKPALIAHPSGSPGRGFGRAGSRLARRRADRRRSPAPTIRFSHRGGWRPRPRARGAPRTATDDPVGPPPVAGSLRTPARRSDRRDRRSRAGAGRVPTDPRHAALRRVARPLVGAGRGRRRPVRRRTTRRRGRRRRHGRRAPRRSTSHAAPPVGASRCTCRPRRAAPRVAHPPDPVPTGPRSRDSRTRSAPARIVANARRRSSTTTDIPLRATGVDSPSARRRDRASSSFPRLSIRGGHRGWAWTPNVRIARGRRLRWV